MPAVAIYTRVSHDPLGESTSTSRQERLCRAFAALRGWEVVQVYEDVDLSAYRQGVRRPEFERLQADLAGLEGVLVWRLDRLVRRPADFERFWGRCEELGVFLASATEPVDSSSEMGVAIVRILVTFAQLESHARGARLQAKAEENARNGAPPRKNPSYGHTDEWRAIVPHEAELIREAARRFLGGESLASIAMSFNRENRRTRSGRPWGGQTLRNLLTAHRMVGDRSFRGEVVGVGLWPPILERADFDEIQRRMADRRRVKPMTRGLLSGWLVCARCGGRLSRRAADHGVNPSYACCTPYIDDETGRQHTCGLGISALATDAWIAHQIQWRSRFASRWHPKLLRLVPAPLTERTWPLLTLSEQRTIIGQHVERIIVLPAGRTGRAGWSESRLATTWKQSLVEAPPFKWNPSAFERAVLAGPKDQITAHEAAHILGVLGTRVTDFRRKGHLVAVEQVGHRWIYSRAEVQKLADHRAQALADGVRVQRRWSAKPIGFFLDVARVYATAVEQRDPTPVGQVLSWAQAHGQPEATRNAAGAWVARCRTESHGYLTAPKQRYQAGGRLTARAIRELAERDSADHRLRDSTAEVGGRQS